MSKQLDFTKSTEKYVNEMKQPWGQMFNELEFYQLENHLSADMKTALSVGCGFGTTDRFLAPKGLDVTGVDLTPSLLEVAAEWATREGLSIRYQELNVEETDAAVFPAPYDMVILHNVLEYLNNPAAAIQKLAQWTRSGGTLSLIIHSIDAKVLKEYFWNEDPAAALAKLDNTDSYSVTIGTALKQYPLEQVIAWCEAAGFELVTWYGIRNIYDYKHTDKKHDPEWHEQALALEKAICNKTPFRDMASFRHLILRKK